MTIGGTVFLAPFDLPNSKGIMARLSFRRAQGKALKFASVALPAIARCAPDSPCANFFTQVATISKPYATERL
jgi:hypothetical protein